MVFADVSGFTKLSERLARNGKSGAEELVGAISSVFTALLTESDSYGGDVLKFGGDALLLMFNGDEHLARACRAAHGMRRVLRQAGRIHTSSGDVVLRMSQGVHTGLFHFFLVGGRHAELVVAGPAATETVAMESAADAGEILLSPAAAERLDPRCVGKAKEGGRLLSAVPKAPEPGALSATAPPGVDLNAFVPMALRGRLATVVDESEHRQVAVAFLHFAGVDALVESDGIDEVQSRLDSLTRAIVDACDEFGVTVICTDIGPDGGKFMLAAGAPEAHENSEERMLRAVRQVVDGDYGLRVRAGVNRGHVYAGAVGAPFRFTYSTMGDAVNLAARVMGKAAFGQVLATAAALERCPGRFEAEPVPPFMVKGKSQPVKAAVVGQALRGSGVAFVESDVALVGRRDAIKRLDELLADVQAGRGNAVELVGEAGIGKSRLVAELVRQAVGFQAVVLQCEQYESNTPYFVARHLLRTALQITAEDAAGAGRQLVESVARVDERLLPWAPLLAMAVDASVPPTPEFESLAPQFRRGRLHEVAAAVLAAALPAPSLVVVEDCGLMDEASAGLLAHLAASADERQWLLCLTRRPVSYGLNPAMGYDVETVELGPLAAPDAAELVDALLGDSALSPHLSARLVERSGGNPLFLRELVAAAASQPDVDDLPGSVESMVAARLDRLRPDDRRLVRYASVLGMRFDTALLAQALAPVLPHAADREAWERVGEFVAVEGEGYRFRSELFRRVAYDALPFSRRRDVHGRVGAVIEASTEPGDETALALLSVHFHHAGRHAQSWRYSVAAADHARAVYANVEAAEFYRRGLEAARALDEVTSQDVARVSEALGDVSEMAAMYDQAAAAYRAARQAAAGDVLAAARLMFKEGRVRERTSRYTDAVRWFGRGLKTLGQADDSRSAEDVAALRARLAVGYATVRQRQGRLADCVKWAEAAVVDATNGRDKATLAHAYFLLDAALTDLGRSEQSDYRYLALPIYEELGDLVGQANVLNNLGIDAYYEGRWDEALELYERDRQARERAGDVSMEATAANNIAEILSDQGRLVEAEALLRRVRQVFRNVNFPVGLALATSNLGRVAGRAGRVDEAIALFSNALTSFEAIKAESFVLETRARMAEMLAAAGRHEQALMLARAVRDGAAASNAAGGVLNAFVLRVEGQALAGLGRLDEARAALEGSLEVGRGAGLPYEAGLTLLALADVEDGLGAAADAAAHRAEGQAILRGLGVTMERASA